MKKFIVAYQSLNRTDTETLTLKQAFTNPWYYLGAALAATYFYLAIFFVLLIGDSSF